jgi:wobble nucleotide-excising tRNase
VLKKIVAITNVGRFKNCNATGDVQFGKATLIYAPNGRGKTTFCDICRSLKTGVPDPILGRVTLGKRDAPAVDFLLESGMVRFKDGAWNGTFPDLEIFDSRFVYDNVYAGECVEHAQRRNLYDVIIGEKGVNLRRRVDQLDDTFREAGQALNEKEIALRACIPGGMPLDKFVALDEDPDVDTKIEAKTKQVAALDSVAELKAKPILAKVSLPAFPAGLDAVLSKTLEDVSEDAEASIRAHMAQHMQRPNESWLGEGTRLLKGNVCPFCAQLIAGSALIALYRSHFAGRYEKLKTEIEQWANRLRNYADQTAVLILERTTHENTRLLVEWREYISDVETPSLDVARVHEALSVLRGTGLALLDVKVKSPLEPVSLGEDFSAALHAVEDATALADAYNAAVHIVNSIILAKKEEAEGGDVARAKRELEELRASKLRQQDNVKKAVEELRATRRARTQADLEKQVAKAELEQYSGDVFQRCQGRINRLLENFGATFRIEKAREHYPGGKPSSTYCLVIEGEEIELGDTNTPLTKPSFKNTLSAGDKSALALAFFLAQLAESVDVSKKVVVLDDPFTSQDASRQTCTQQEIRRLASTVAQVIVLSHDRRFLKRVWDGMEASLSKTLQFSNFGDTTVTEWDIETVQDEYVATYTTLWRYCNRSEGDPHLVVRTIRPLLEGYLRMKLPREFPDNKWLGDYVKQIQDADSKTPVGQAKPFLSELVDLKDYAKRYHHPAGPEVPDEPVDAQEVLAFGKRALRLVEGF